MLHGGNGANHIRELHAFTCWSDTRKLLSLFAHGLKDAHMSVEHLVEPSDSGAHVRIVQHDICRRRRRIFEMQVLQALRHDMSNNINILLGVARLIKQTFIFQIK